MNILVIAAHPDDELLGCGGTMIKYVKKKATLNILIMAEGLTSRDVSRNVSKHEDNLLELKTVAKEIGNIIGAKNTICLDYPDNRMDDLNRLDIIKTIEKYIQEFKPSVIYTHHPEDTNIDHRVIADAVITACRPQPNCRVRKIMSFETLSSTEWQNPNVGNGFRANIFEDVSNEIDFKIELLMKYKSEMRPWPHPRSSDAVNYLAKLRGSTIGVEAAEAFQLIREIL